MGKHHLSDAAARRVTEDFLLRLGNEPGAPHELLLRAIRREKLSPNPVLGRMLVWLGENHPALLPQVAVSLADRVLSLEKRTTDLFDAFEALSTEIDYEHYHFHSSEDGD